MKACLPLLIILLIASSMLAQESNKPALSSFDKLIRGCKDAENVIDSERKRLGASFEKELLNYLGDDVDKHYWMACGLSGCCRQDNDPVLEKLSLLIRHQALSLLRDKKDDHSLYTVVSLHVLSAVQSEQLGFHNLAIMHKSEAEWLVSEKPILKGGFPAMSKGEWKIYDSLPKQPKKQRSACADRLTKNRRRTKSLDRSADSAFFNLSAGNDVVAALKIL